MPDIEVDQTPRYAIDEIERRWLVDSARAPDTADLPFRLYEDLYIANSRLRLRKITEIDGTYVYKLGKKYGKKSVLSEPITTLYLDGSEYDRFRVMDGHFSVKRRYSIAGGYMDIYQKPNAGLVVFEIEFNSEDAATFYSPPVFVTREITNVAEYSGFRLAWPPG